ncbi:MAG: TetR/AcrR family transcriptional regulator [Homoserinimonas sp.]
MGVAGVTSEPARRGRPGYDQQAILEVAVTAFNEFGYDATSMGVLADRLSLSKAAIYHHFASKEELLERALDEALGSLEAVFVVSETRATSAIDRLNLVLRGAVHVLCAKLPYVKLLLRVRGNTVVETNALARRRELDRVVAALVLDACDEGALRRDIDPRIVTRLLFGMVSSIAEWYRPAGPADAEKLADDVLAFAIDGLRMPAADRLTEVASAND